jgi:hypothetical protein
MPSDQDQTTNIIYSIAVRFGNEVLQAGFTSAPNLVLKHYAKLGITPAEMMFTIHIWQYWWTEKDPYPSLKAIAAMMAVSLRQVHNYAASLRKKGYLNVKQRYEPGLGQMTSEYDFSALIQAVVQLEQGSRSTPLKNPSSGGVKDISGARVKSASPEEYKEQEYTVEEYPVGSIYRTEQTEKKGRSNRGEVWRGGGAPSPGGETEHRLESEPTAVGEILKRRSTTSPADAPESPRKGPGSAYNGRGEPNYQPASKGPAKRARADRPARRRVRVPESIQALLQQWSALDFHDEGHTPSNISQAANIFTASGLSESSFIAKMYEARKITQQRATTINKKAEGSAWQYNRAPYFFACLRDLLGLKEEQERAAEGAPAG